MISLYYKQDDTVEINDRIYHLRLAFDNVLKIIDMLNDERLPALNKINLGLKMLIGEEIDCDFETKNQLFIDLFSRYINNEDEKPVERDLVGNPIPTAQYSKDKESFYSLKYDADYIYSAFMQIYKIDLIEQQGKLHWKKFQALLMGLPEETKFRQIIAIRMWNPNDEKESHKSRMIKLKKLYKLPDDEDEEVEDFG